MSSGGVSKVVDKVTGGAEDLWGSVKDDPLGALVTAGTLGMGTAVVNGAVQTGTRVRDDQRDQAEGQAESEQRRADAAMAAQRADAARAEAQAVDRSVKDADPIAIERRRRATLAGRNGREGTILTGGMSLGSADTARKVLLGL